MKRMIFTASLVVFYGITMYGIAMDAKAEAHKMVKIDKNQY